MAFMMPVIKPDYKIYSGQTQTAPGDVKMSKKSTRSASLTPRMSTYSGSDIEYRVTTPFKALSSSTSRKSSHCGFITPTPKSASRMSIHKFHSNLVDKLKRKLRLQDSKNNSGDEVYICDSSRDEETYAL
ncbi:uncharacterized protein LOC106468854 [Limulus polyphemus]|uniref:Uncharacterized protein LOC106468854 n=1 Tax=Limulus polyphemus TaxID=6850 RepID=A0ABM1BM31_LIMPO|nr:uncharacterized protein LOC106468854 [Limulus polyphemus]